MRIVFMGSAELSRATLLALGGGPHRLAGVVSQPDRPWGRRRQLRPNPLKARAMGMDVPTAAPENVNDEPTRALLRAWAPEAIVVVAYGQILKPTLLEIPPRGCINVHTSLLPAYRGAPPLQWAIANGETRTGVTTMQMSAGMDEGDVLLQRALAIEPGETAGELQARLAPLGAALLLDTLARLEAGTLKPRPQDAAAATYAPKLRKADGQIDWTLPAPSLYNRIRGFNPWPGCYCGVPPAGGAPPVPLKVHAARVEAGRGAAGELLEAGREGPLIAAGQGALRLTQVQPAGGRVMDGGVYLSGHPLTPGTRFA